MSDEMNQAALQAEQVGAAHQTENALALAQEAGLSEQQAAASASLQDLSLRAGRIQAAKLMSAFADTLTVSQLREMKALAQAAGLTWVQACKRIGISTKTADQYLRLGADLGDDWVADARAIGVSIRALEDARRLPEEARRKLISGEAVDSEEVTKEELTRVIRELAADHAQEMGEKDQALKKETRAREQAERKYRETAYEMEALKEGLPADDRRALAEMQDREAGIVAYLVRVKNTMDLQGRDPHTVARLTNGLMLIKELAEATALAVGARAQGLEPDDEALLGEARDLNQGLAEHDGRAPHPGI